MVKKVAKSNSPAVIKMSCQSVIPMPATRGVIVRTKEEIAAVFFDNKAYENLVTEYTKIKVLISVRSPMKWPKSEKTRT